MMGRSLTETVKDDNIEKYKSNFPEIQVSVAHMRNRGCFYMARMKGRNRGIAEANARKES